MNTEDMAIIIYYILYIIFIIGTYIFYFRFGFDLTVISLLLILLVRK